MVDLDAKRNKTREALRQLRSTHSSVKEDGNIVLLLSLILILTYSFQVLGMFWQYLHQNEHNGMCSTAGKRYTGCVHSPDLISFHLY